MILPEGAIIIRRDPDKEVAQSGLILSTKPVVQDTGVIVYTSPELEQFKNKKAKFRESFTEPIDIYGEKLVYVRDWKQGTFYIE